MIKIPEHLKDKPTPDMEDWERVLIQGIDFLDDFNEWLSETEYVNVLPAEEQYDHEMELYKLLVEYKGRIRSKEMYDLVNKKLPSKTFNSGFKDVIDRNIKNANSMIKDISRSYNGSTRGKRLELLELLYDLSKNPTNYLDDKIRYTANRDDINNFLKTHNYTKKAKDTLIILLNTF